MEASLLFVPYFIISYVTVILTLSLVIWQRVRETPANKTDAYPPDRTLWVLFSLLLTAVFGLGAFVMYALLFSG